MYSRPKPARAGALEQEVEKVNSGFEQLLARNLDSLNDRLKSSKLAPITRLTREEFDKRQR